MVRGRRQNPDAPPSRQLEISRAFRQRRAKDLEELRGQLARLEEENGQLRKENEQLKALGLWGKKTGTDATPSAAGTPCVRCSMLQTELNRMVSGNASLRWPVKIARSSLFFSLSFSSAF